MMVARPVSKFVHNYECMCVLPSVRPSVRVHTHALTSFTFISTCGPNSWKVKWTDLIADSEQHQHLSCKWRYCADVISSSMLQGICWKSGSQWCLWCFQFLRQPDFNYRVYERPSFENSGFRRCVVEVFAFLGVHVNPYLTNVENRVSS